MRRAIELLARLRRHALDAQRVALAGLTDELDRNRARQVELEHRLVREHALAFELPGGPQPLVGYRNLARARASALRAAELRTAQAVATAEELLRQRLRDWKGLDLAAAELRRRDAQNESRRAAARIDEAASLKAAAAAQNSGASVTSSPSSAGPNLIWQDSRELSRTSNASSSIMLSSELAASSRGSQGSAT
jgi:hypothetical protein